jgi:hypothetical protein
MSERKALWEYSNLKSTEEIPQSVSSLSVYGVSQELDNWDGVPSQSSHCWEALCDNRGLTEGLGYLLLTGIAVLS